MAEESKIEEESKILNTEEQTEIQNSQAPKEPADGGDSGGGGEEDNQEEVNDRIQYLINLSDVEKETMRGLFPSRNLFTFESGIQITSDFDSGNLSKCIQGSTTGGWAG